MQNIQTSLTERFSPCLTIPPARIVPGLVDDVREGLLNKPRSLPPKYFYDEKGSLLFSKICETPEYYPTRTEDNLLNEFSQAIINQVRPDEILELGSGTSQKTRRLFSACETIEHNCSYAPFDVCEPMLEQTADQLSSEYPWLTVKPLLGDYHAGLKYLPDHEGRRLYVFIGSTIGNFTTSEAHLFLRDLQNKMRNGDFLLLGLDRVKDEQVLNAAYNDQQGITAEFNLNVLRVLNRELQADFDINNFVHHASFNVDNSRIEMRLVSRNKQTIKLGHINEHINFVPDDDILTELSHKFTYAGAESLLTDCGFTIRQHYQPGNKFFSLILAQYLTNKMNTRGQLSCP